MSIIVGAIIVGLAILFVGYDISTSLNRKCRPSLNDSPRIDISEVVKELKHLTEAIKMIQPKKRFNSSNYPAIYSHYIKSYSIKPGETSPIHEKE